LRYLNKKAAQEQSGRLFHVGLNRAQLNFDFKWKFFCQNQLLSCRSRRFLHRIGIFAFASRAEFIHFDSKIAPLDTTIAASWAEMRGGYRIPGVTTAGGTRRQANVKREGLLVFGSWKNSASREGQHPTR
jgi:hypothetical protein